MKKILIKIRKRRDERFLRRLERVLNENVIDATMRISGFVEAGAPVIKV